MEKHGVPALDEDDTYVRWVSYGRMALLTFVGKEAIAFGGGCFVSFFDPLTGRILRYRANGPARGDGVGCMAGHRSLPVFAFAELAFDARIIVVSYPEFSIISTFKEPTQTSYVSMTFAESDLLVTLSGAPGFHLAVWRWRTAELLTSVASSLHAPDQIIRCSQSVPLAVCQMSSKSRRLVVWEAHVCFKRVLLTRHEVCLPAILTAPFTTVWSPEGVLHAIDQLANLYTMEADWTMRLSLAWPGDGGNLSTSAVWFKSGLVVSGPDCTVKLLRRGPRGWTEIWSASSDPYHVLHLAALGSKEVLLGGARIVGSCCQIAVVQWNMDPASPRFDPIWRQRINFTDMCLVLPLGELLVAVHVNSDLIVVDVKDFSQVSEVRAREGERVLAMRANPAAPIVALSRTTGLVELLSLFVPAVPSTLYAVRLCDRDIDALEFSPSGSLLVAAVLNTGDFFFVKLQPGIRVEVVAHATVAATVACWTLSELDHELQTHVLLRGVACCLAGDTIVSLALTVGTWGLRTHPPVKFPGRYAQLVSVGMGKRFVIGVPHRSRKLHTLKLPMPGMPLIKPLLDSRPSGHLLRRYAAAVALGLTLTFGLDGLVVVRRGDTREAALVTVLHHRTSHGVATACLTPAGDGLVSLGRDGTMICTALKTPIVSGEKVAVRLSSDADWIKLLTTPPAAGSMAHGKTWLDLQADKRLVQETVQFSATRRALLKELNEIKDKTVELLERNFTNPEEERLDVREFDLDVAGRADATREAAEAREAFETRTLALSAARDAMARKVTGLCWDTMEVKGRSIKAMLGNFDVENFALPPPDTVLEQQLARLTERRKVEQILGKSDEFFPWMAVPHSELAELLQSSPRMAETETDDIRLTLLADDETDGVQAEPSEPAEPDDVWTGTSSYQFVDTSPIITSQLAITTYAQVADLVIVIKAATHELRLFFNKQFNETLAMKEREMAMVAERNERLRYILSELKNTTTEVSDPIWHPHERPEAIVTVLDSEVVALPYVTPAEQARRDEIAAEAEARRLAELADNFREKALIEMMDGVLEVRWEDIIKKDIPLPKCMVERLPDDWNEEDLRVVHEYEEKVAHLMSERERYKNMLEAEFQKLSATVKDGMRRFDQKLAELHALRLRVQAAICQENLKVLRARLHCQHRIELDRKEVQQMRNMSEYEVVMETMHAEVASLQATSLEGRQAFEALQAKEKLLDKTFRRDFADTTQLVMDLLLKAYKRRPKGQSQGPRGHVAPAMLLETARCVSTQERPTCLSSDCTDFLRGVDSLDVVSAIPAALPDELWPTLCRTRRLRIDNELRLKACALEMAEADATIGVYQARMVAAKETATAMAHQLHALRTKKIEMATNIEIQLVLKQGLVEIPLSGRLSDFRDAVLIKRYNIEAVNKDIRNAGKKKLNAMNETMKFRRGIICMEWEHKSLKMEIEDLTDNLRSIELFKVSKEIQDILRRRFRGMPEEKGSITATLDKEMNNLRKYYERMFLELAAETQETERQVAEKMQANRRVDKAIVELNVAVNEQQLRRDYQFEDREAHAVEERIAAVMHRSRLCTKIQKQHGEILVLQTELELLRLRTYPTLNYQTLA